MAKAITGVDIDNCYLKMASCGAGAVGSRVVKTLPEGMMSNGHISSTDAMADLLKETVKETGGMAKDAALVLPAQDALVRCLTMPVMSEKELLVNLPYEFRDYISQGKDHYTFDYAMLGVNNDDEGKPESMELLACAALKQTIEDYEQMFYRAGMRLRIALPHAAALQNLVNERAAGRTMCLLDLGYSATTLHFFADGKLSTVRTIEVGCQDIDNAIAAAFSVDDFVARSYRENAFQDARTRQEVQEIYEQIAVEVGRAMNFFAFSNPDYTVDGLYLYGIGTEIAELREAIAGATSIPCEAAGTLLGMDAVDGQALACLPAIYATAGGDK